jgi:Lon protease-like protein
VAVAAHASRIVLPIFPLNGIVLLPGETLPLRLFTDSYVGLIQRLLSKGGTFTLLDACVRACVQKGTG